jgi:hypothetical protein
MRLQDPGRVGIAPHLSWQPLAHPGSSSVLRIIEVICLQRAKARNTSLCVLLGQRGLGRLV